MSSSKGQGRRGPTTRSMTRVSARGKVTKLPSRSRVPASPAPMPTTSSSQSRPGSSSQQSTKSIPVSQTAESSTTNDDDNKLNKAARGLLNRLEEMRKVVGVASRDYESKALQKKDFYSKKVRTLKGTLEVHEKECVNECVEGLMKVLTRRVPKEADIRSVLMLHYTANLHMTRAARKYINLAQGEFDLIRVRKDVHHDSYVLINNLIDCISWLIELLEGKVQPPKETFNAQTYYLDLVKIMSKLKGLFSARMYLETKIMEEEGSMEEQFNNVSPEKWSPIIGELNEMVEERLELKKIYRTLLVATSKDRMGMATNVKEAMDMMKIVPRILQKNPPKILEVDKMS